MITFSVKSTYATILLLILISISFSLETFAQNQEKIYTIQLNRNVLNSSSGRSKTMLRAGDIEVEGSSFMLALSDTRSDGIFTNKYDSIILGEYKADSTKVRFEVNETYVSEEKGVGKIFKVDDKFFKIVEIDTKGNFIKFTPIYGKNIKYDIRRHELKLVPLDFELINGSTDNFANYLHKGKYIYVEIWGMWCPPCVAATDNLKKTYAYYSDNLEIISLNSRDSKKEVKAYLAKKGVKWVNGVVNNRIRSNLFHGPRYPYGVLFDEKGNLVKQDLHPASLHYYILEKIPENKK